MKSIQVKLGQAIQRLRKSSGRLEISSQEKLAAVAGINRGYMGSIERGEVNLSLHNIEKIAKALGITVGQLMTEVDKEK